MELSVADAEAIMSVCRLGRVLLAGTDQCRVGVFVYKPPITPAYPGLRSLLLLQHHPHRLSSST